MIVKSSKTEMFDVVSLSELGVMSREMRQEIQIRLMHIRTHTASIVPKPLICSFVYHLVPFTSAARVAPFATPGAVEPLGVQGKRDPPPA
jgi:hypothetical protein